jgi:hypothetical protein
MSAVSPSLKFKLAVLRLSRERQWRQIMSVIAVVVVVVVVVVVADWV